MFSSIHLHSHFYSLKQFHHYYSKELTGFEGTIKCTFPVLSVKPNPSTRPCLTAMPLKLPSEKPCWRIRWIPHRNTKTAHSQSSVRWYALHTPLEVKTDSPNEPEVTEGGCTLLLLLFPEKAVWMGEGRNGQVTCVLLERSCTHYQQHFLTYFKTCQPHQNPTTTAENYSVFFFKGFLRFIFDFKIVNFTLE